MSDRLRTLSDVRDHLPPGLPPDPFADDPHDPSFVLDAIEPGQPLDPQERTAVEADLADLAVYKKDDFAKIVELAKAALGK